MSKFELQASQYSFPYHWIPFEHEGRWQLARVLLWGHEYLAILSAVRDAVVALNPNRVLDFGCGDGRLSNELLRAGVREVVGVDLVAEAISFAQAFNFPYAERARFECRRVQDLEAGEFDVAAAMEVLEHVPDEELAGVVSALAARLRPGGHLVLSVPTTNIPLHRKHERHYTADLLSAHLRPSFGIVDVQYVHRIGWLETLVRRGFVNRVACTLSPAMNGRLTEWYRRHVWAANPRTGAHLVAVCRRTHAGKGSNEA